MGQKIPFRTNGILPDNKVICGWFCNDSGKQILLGATYSDGSGRMLGAVSELVSSDVSLALGLIRRARTCIQHPCTI